MLLGSVSQLCVRVCVFQEDAGLQAFRLYVCEQAAQLKVFSEELEHSVAALKQDVAAIVRRKRERSGTWS